MTKGGPRHTHELLAIAKLEELAMEAQSAQVELAEGHKSAVETAWLFLRFSAEVEDLARQSVRHLRLVPCGEISNDVALAERLAA